MATSRFARTAVLLLVTLSLAAVLLVSGCGQADTSIPTAGSTETSTTTGTTSTFETTATGTSTTAAAEPVGETTSTLTGEQQGYLKLVADTLDALNNVKSYRFTLYMDMVTNTTTAADTSVEEIKVSASGAIDLAAKNTQMSLNMSAYSDQPSFLDEFRNINMELYMLTEWLYMKMDMPIMGEQWVKVPVTDEVRDTYDLDIADEQFELLDSPVDIELVREESLNGKIYLVLNIVPDEATILGWAQQQDPDLDTAQQVASSIKDLSYLVWIAKDTSLLRKMTIEMSMEMLPGHSGVGQTDFDKATIDISMIMQMEGYNEPVIIVLPPGAEDAIEVPAGVGPSA
jgi:hypothetical protein